MRHVVKASTQAMFEFQRLLDRISYSLKLQRTGEFWELWFVGDDFGKSEAEVAELEQSITEGDYIYRSTSYGAIKITPDGAIRSFDFGIRYVDRSVLDQLIFFLNNSEWSEFGIVDIHIDLRPNGDKIDVDVIAVEDFSGYNSDNEFVEQQVTRVVGRFAYDPTSQLLLHRTS